MESLLHDLRYAVRALRRSPGFTALAILTLGLGIGAATAGFAILEQVLLDPLPGLRDPARLGLVWFSEHRGGGFRVQGVDAEGRATILRASPAVAALAGVQLADLAVAVPGQDPQRFLANFVTGDYFATLGASPARGRLLTPDDDPPNGGTRVAVITDALWHDGFGGRPDVVGRRLIVNGLSVTVVGVTQPGFLGTGRFLAPKLWLPGNAYFDLNHLRGRIPWPSTYDYYEHVLRLRSRATFDQASAQLRGAVQVVAAGDTAHLSPKVTADV